MTPNYEIEIIEVNATADLVEAFARVWKDGVQIGFGTDGTVDIERFRVFNPPILVPDPLGDVVITQQAMPELGLPYREDTYREDPTEALLQVIQNTVESLQTKFGPEAIIPEKRGNTITTVYSGAADEYCFANLATWTGSRDSAGVGSSNTATILAVQASFETVNYTIYRSLLPFDTSAIGTDVISAATFNFTPQTNDSGGVDDQSMCIDKTTTITPATSDYNKTNFDGVDQSARAKISTFTVNTQVSLALNATGIGNINKTGTTNFGMRFSFDMDNTTPVSPSNVQRTFPYSSEETGTTRDPNLVITHSAAGGGVNSGFFNFM